MKIGSKLLQKVTAPDELKMDFRSSQCLAAKPIDLNQSITAINSLARFFEYDLSRQILRSSKRA